ncbi:MAG: SDR family NAD(P)-dependent oxidoreductase, partial [Glaciecola sp.]|nr:SDR family NAD(P)-dependent oxidoreductase [Glaciecola sp.]
MNVAPEYVKGHNLLQGKSVLVTAAAGAGIGFSAALRAAEEGCRALMISDIHPGRLVKAVDAIKEKTGLENVFAQLCDVSKEEQVQALINQAEEKLQGVDVLINNAGLGGQASVVDMTDAQWNMVIDITLTGTFRMTRAMLPFMQQRKAGVIINNA